MTMIELLAVVTLTLTLVSSPSHGSLHRTRRQTLNELLDGEEDSRLPTTVSIVQAQSSQDLNLGLEMSRDQIFDVLVLKLTAQRLGLGLLTFKS